MQTKNGTDHATSGPLFIPTSLFHLFPVHLLTLLLIGGRLFSLSNTRLSNPWAEMSIFQLSIIFGVYARLETLYTHMTFARFAQGLAALYH
jgi:hypothetical protein